MTLAKQKTGHTLIRSGQLSQFKRSLTQLIAMNSDNIENLTQVIFDYTCGHCFYCGKKLYIHDEEKGVDILDEEASHDHLIPVSMFGLLVEGNAVLSCSTCNGEKTSMSAEAYYLKRVEENKHVFFDTYEKFMEAINELFEIYRKNWPLYASLNKRIESGEVTEVALSDLINFSKANFVNADLVFEVNSASYFEAPRKDSPSNDENKEEILINQRFDYLIENKEKFSPLFSASNDRDVVKKKELMSKHFSDIMIEASKFFTKTSKRTYYAELNALYSLGAHLYDRAYNDIDSLGRMSKDKALKEVTHYSRLKGRSEESTKNLFTYLSLATNNKELMLNDKLIISIDEHLRNKKEK